MELYSLGALVEPLCLWYEENKRSMPWREEATPYHVWISEIMLQQTRIEAAKGYYERFIKRLPSIESLADISEEELLKLWEGLGYYNRARNLHKTARIVVEKYDGNLPADYDLLLELPGIGNYTAGAIVSIAYQIPAPAVDGNVLRVLMRVLNCRDDISKQSVRRKMERSIMAVIPKEIPGVFNQALMELGEVICIPSGAPHCEECPLALHCMGMKDGTCMELPVKPEKKERKKEKKTILLFEQGGRMAIVKRPSQGLLADMWEFPSLSEHCTMTQVHRFLDEQGIPVQSVERLKDAKHIFSHIEWHMRGYHIMLSESESLPLWETDDKNQHLVWKEIVWAEKKELSERYAIPVAYHSFLRQLTL